MAPVERCSRSEPDRPRRAAGLRVPASAGRYSRLQRVTPESCLRPGAAGFLPADQVRRSYAALVTAAYMPLWRTSGASSSRLHCQGQDAIPRAL